MPGGAPGTAGSVSEGRQLLNVHLRSAATRRPAVIISYLVSGLAALLAAACYAELCVEYPVSGGAFSYIMVGATHEQ